MATTLTIPGAEGRSPLVLVTGASGFAGSLVVRKLAESVGAANVVLYSARSTLRTVKGTASACSMVRSNWPERLRA